jgi:hypothetical protein
MPNLPAFIVDPFFTPEQITKKWDDIGFLEALRPEQKQLVAGYFEESMSHILATDSWDQDLRAMLMLASIRRLMFDHDTLNMVEFHEKFDHFFENEMRDHIAEYELHADIDGQAESLMDFCLDYDNYGAHFKGKLKKLKQLKY